MQNRFVHTNSQLGHKNTYGGFYQFDAKPSAVNCPSPKGAEWKKRRLCVLREPARLEGESAKAAWLALDDAAQAAPCAHSQHDYPLRSFRAQRIRSTATAELASNASGRRYAACRKTTAMLESRWLRAQEQPQACQFSETARLKCAPQHGAGAPYCTRAACGFAELADSPGDLAMSKEPKRPRHPPTMCSL